MESEHSSEESNEMHGQDLTEGNLRQQLWSVSWPIMLSVFFYTLYNIVDAIWVGRLSAEAIAAVSISQISLFIMVALGMGITVGSGVVLSMHIGAGEKDDAKRVLGQSFVLSGLLALFFTAVALVFRDQILVLSGAHGAVFEPAQIYFTIVALGSILMFTMMNIVFAFNAQGDNFTTTKLFALSTGINLILDPVLIFGWWGAPALGIAGAAYATLISQAIFIIIALRALARPTQMIPFAFKNLCLRKASALRVLDIGFPASLTQVIFPLGLAALMLIVAKAFYELGTIAFSIAFRIEFFAYLPAIGFGFGSMALIGQNIGAGNITRAWDALMLAFKYSVSAAVVLGVIGIILAEPIIRIFTADPTVIEYVSGYILIVGLSYGFLAASLVEVSAFQAIGRSWPGFWLFMLRVAAVSVPLAYVLTMVYGMSMTGVWIALALGNIVTSIVGYIWIRGAFQKLDSGAATE